MVDDNNHNNQQFFFAYGDRNLVEVVKFSGEIGTLYESMVISRLSVILCFSLLVIPKVSQTMSTTVSQTC